MTLGVIGWVSEFFKSFKFFKTKFILLFFHAVGENL